jgi:hypothetical protein
VTLTLAFDAEQLSVSPSTLTFTTSDWSVAKVSALRIFCTSFGLS